MTIKNIKTDNIPLLDETVFYLKRLSLSVIMKDEEKALANESLESLKNGDLYITCVEGRARFDLFESFTAEQLRHIGLPEYTIDLAVKDKNDVPYDKRDALTKVASVDFINNYVEDNNYYREINGYPNTGDPGIKLSADDVPSVIVGIDLNKYVHEMTNPEIDALYIFKVIDKLIELYPTKKYLESMGSRKVSIYTARQATNFSMLYMTDEAPIQILSRFKTKMELNKTYTMKTIYSDAFKYGSDYYDNFIRILILTQTMIDIIIEIPEIIIKKDIFDLRTVELIFQSNGIDYFPDIPLKYQLAMIKNINMLLKYKSTTTNIVDICSIFGFDNIKVFKYYLLKDRNMTKDGKDFQFNYKEILDDDGAVIVVDDEDANYDLKFIKVPIDEMADDYIQGRKNYVTYDEAISNDKYWNGDLSYDVVKSAIVAKEFNYIQSKYISIDTIYEMTDLSFQITYFFNMLFDNSTLEDELMMNIPYLGDSNHRFTDIICYLFSLMYEYNNLEDSIMDTQTQVLYVKGFNFSVSMSDLSAYVHERGFTLEELGVSNFKVPSTSVLTYKQLMSIFTNNKNIYDHVVYEMGHANNKRIYSIYKYLFDSMMITELTFDFFKNPNGTTATHYTEFLSHRDAVLHNSIQEVKIISTDVLKKEKISDIISSVVYTVESYIDLDDYKFIFAKLPTVSAEAVKVYIYKVINFFKSYKIDIMSINIIYLFNDKYENRIKMIDEMILTYMYTKTEVVSILSQLQMTTTLTHKERLDLIEKLYIEITYWVDIYCTDKITTRDRVDNIISKMLKKTYCKLIDTINITPTYGIEELPTSSGQWVAFSNNGVHMAVGHVSYPFLSVYKRNGDTFTKLPNPSVLPTSYGEGVTFSPNGKFMVVVNQITPYLTIYKISGDTFTKINNPSILPAGLGNGVIFSSDSLHMAVAHATSPYITIYKVIGDAFTKVPNPLSLPTSTGYRVDFSSNGVYLAVAYHAAPYLAIYKRSGDTFTRLPNPIGTITGLGIVTAFSPDGELLAITHNASPFLTIFRRSGDTFTKIANPPIMPTSTGYGLAFSSDSKYMAVSHQASPYILVYKRSGDLFIKMPDPAIIPTGNGEGVAFSPDGRFMTVTHYNAPYISIYKLTYNAAGNMVITYHPGGNA